MIKTFSRNTIIKFKKQSQLKRIIKFTRNKKYIIKKEKDTNDKKK
jgi:hypothetical protein